MVVLISPVPKLDKVVEPETLRVPVMLVVAREEVPVMKVAPETVRPVLDAVARVVCPPTVRMLEIVAEPVMPRVLEAEVQVKLPEPPVVVAAV